MLQWVPSERRIALCRWALRMRSHRLAGLALLLVLPTHVAAQTAISTAMTAMTAITNSNFKIAVSAWTADSTTAAATYGPIASWNTAAVTDMSSVCRFASLSAAYLCIFKEAPHTCTNKQTQILCEPDAFQHIDTYAEYCTCITSTCSVYMHVCVHAPAHTRSRIETHGTLNSLRITSLLNITVDRTSSARRRSPRRQRSTQTSAHGTRRL